MRTFRVWMAIAALCLLAGWRVVQHVDDAKAGRSGSGAGETPASISQAMRTNAVNLVNIYQSARSSGVANIPCTSKDALIDALEAGIVVIDESSPYAGRRFSIGRLEADMRSGMKRYLRLDGDSLQFVHSGDDAGS